MYIYMEDIYITNVKVQSVYCIKDAYGRLVWNSRMDYFYRRLLWHTYVHFSKYLIWQNVLILWERIEMFGRLALNISSTISILTVHRI